MKKTELGAWIALSVVPDLGPARFRKLLGRFGGPESVLAASLSDLADVVGKDVARSICQASSSDGVAKTIQWLEQEEHDLVTLADQRYPVRLLQIADPPPLLYVDGDVEALSAPAFAIVGSRSPSPQGLSSAKHFARALSEVGLTIVSGLALGIDSAAHHGGLAGASGTIAVLGTGVDIVYPARNRELAREITQKGALVSEFPLGYPVMAANFPRRNRLISGLSLGCLVVEAALHSGSLITARLALEQDREVFAIPGSIHSPLAKGPHSLIKQGAKLVEEVADILQELNLPATVAPIAERALEAQSGEAGKLLRAMGYDACAIDTLCAHTGLPASAASALLLVLELEGKVASLPGGLYQRVY